MDPSTPSPAPQPRWQPLDSRQRRVLGVLIEKAKTTPAGYPMTVNAVVVGCNQKSNREPLMSLEAFDVEKTLDQLRTMGAVSEVDWIGRAAKYKHHGYEWLGVTKAEIAVMTELLLRGEQTLGDLRARASRMETIHDLAELKTIVDGLIQRGLMIEVTPAGRGQIVSHNLYSEQEKADLHARHSGRRAGAADDRDRDHRESSPHGATAGAPGAAASPAVAELAAAIVELRRDVDLLRAELDALKEHAGS